MEYTNAHNMKVSLWHDHGIRFHPHLIGPYDKRWPEKSHRKERVLERIKYIDSSLESNPELKHKFYTIIFEDLSLEKEVLDHAWSKMSALERKEFFTDVDRPTLENMLDKRCESASMVVDHVIHTKNISFVHDTLVNIGKDILAGEKVKSHEAINKLCKFAWTNFKLISKPHFTKQEVVNLDDYEALYVCLKTMYPLKKYINEENVGFPEVKNILRLLAQTYSNTNEFLNDFTELVDTKPLKFVKPNLIILELLDLKLHSDSEAFWETLFTRNKKEAHVELPSVEF